LKKNLKKVNNVLITKNIVNNIGNLPQLTVSYNFNENNNTKLILTGTITNNGGSEITGCGFNVYYVINTITENTNTIATQIPCSLNNNQFTTEVLFSNCSDINVSGGYELFVINYQAYATNIYGTTNTIFSAYNNYHILCIVENSLITLYDGTQKFIQDITYDDLLLVWDFDNGCFTSSKPLWIKKQDETNEYYEATFDNNYKVNFVNKHRFYNYEKGKFTNLFKNNNIKTITQDNNLITLTKLELVEKTVKYYNLITEYHINFYVNGILSSCRYNNIYPIKNMKFEKVININNNNNNLVPLKYLKGMRILEQTKHINNEYINRLIITESKINKLLNNKKIIFLDHSGVMTKNKGTRDFDEININYINLICKYFCINIIISSDWTEFMTFEEIKLIYKNYNLPEPIDYTHKKKYHTYKKISCEEIRATEINDWIENNNYKISDALIFDDLDLRKYFSNDNFVWINTFLLSNHL
jgi:hypothetical protein